MFETNYSEAPFKFELIPIKLRSVSFQKLGNNLIDNISLSINSKGITIILGPNGAGKSILMRLLHGLEKPSSGEVLFNGINLNNTIRLKQAMVFQNAVLLRRTVIENLSFVASLQRPKQTSNLNKLLQEVGLYEKKNLPARRLSGGEKQRLSLARALVSRPELLLLDEPTASLDPYSVQMIETLLIKLRNQNTKIIFITHDLNQARRLAEDIIFIHKGKLEAYQSARVFFNNPESKFAQAFVQGKLIF